MYAKSIFLPVSASADSNSQGIALFKQALRLQQKAQTHQDLKNAATKYEDALRIFEKRKFSRGISAVANNLGLIYKDCQFALAPKS